MAFVTINVPANPITSKNNKKTKITESLRLSLILRGNNRTTELSERAVRKAIIKGIEMGSIKYAAINKLTIKKINVHCRFVILRKKGMTMTPFYTIIISHSIILHLKI